MSVFIIAEAGSNWYAGEGETGALQLARALALIYAASLAGCDSAKFQAFMASDLYVEGTDHWKTVKPLELPLEWLPILARACDSSGIEFMCSAFSEAMVDSVDPYVKRHKVASLEITDLSLLRHIASKGKPVIMSTGAATYKDVAVAVKILPNAVRLHCTTAYPCPPEDANVRRVRPMMVGEEGCCFPIPKMGLSDHTLDPVVAPIMAVALGATTIEKHFTLSRSLQGPDHAYALEPHELKQMVDAIRLAEKMLGDGVKRVMPSEEQWVRFQHRDGGVRGG